MILTDWVMPGMDGIELCRQLRGHTGAGHVYIIVVTGQEAARKSEALAAGADDFLSKPIAREELLAHVRVGERIIRLEDRLKERSRDISRYNAELALANERLRMLAVTDELTGLVNRREIMARLREQWAVSHRYNEPLCAILADIDHFKRFNDMFGHFVGDRVLQATAGKLRGFARSADMVGVLAGKSFWWSARARAWRPRAQRRNACDWASLRTSFPPTAQEYAVTVSFGISARTGSMADPRTS